MQKLYSILPYGLLVVVMGFLSFAISYLVIPRVIAIVKAKNLMDTPNYRSSHKERTPTMGGVGFFASILFCLFFMHPYDEDNIGMPLVVGLLVLFYIGVKDDLVGISPKAKIGGQIFSSILAMASTGVCIQSFDGFLGIYELPLFFSYFFGVFTIVSIVNSYNLIDGINGLASMVGSVIFGIFGYLFYLSKDYYYVLLCAVGIGFLQAFLRYNISGNSRNTIFMGDTGSMIVGFIIGICSLKFLNLVPIELVNANVSTHNKFIIIIAILFVPFIDTTRVFIIRTLKNGKPFFADRNHVHHVIVDYTGLNHVQASILLAVFNLLVFLGIYSLNKYVSPLILFVILFLLIVGITLLLFYFNKSFAVRKRKNKIQKILDKVGMTRK